MPSRRQRALRSILPIVGFAAAFFATQHFWSQGVPFDIAGYLSVAVLAGLDSVFGGIRAGLEHRFRSEVFLSGFVTNMVLAVGLVRLGEVIGVTDMYLAAVVMLGGRIFLNLSYIRRDWLERHPVRGEK